MGVGGKPQIAPAESAGESFVCRPGAGSGQPSRTRGRTPQGLRGAVSDPSRSTLPGRLDPKGCAGRVGRAGCSGQGPGVRALAYVAVTVPRQPKAAAQARP
jgi:hypothetical protein